MRLPGMSKLFQPGWQVPLQMGMKTVSYSTYIIHRESGKKRKCSRMWMAAWSRSVTGYRTLSAMCCVIEHRDRGYCEGNESAQEPHLSVSLLPPRICTQGDEKDQKFIIIMMATHDNFLFWCLYFMFFLKLSRICFRLVCLCDFYIIYIGICVILVFCVLCLFMRFYWILCGFRNLNF